MSRNGMALRARAELIAANVRGAYQAVETRAPHNGPAPLADVIPLRSAPPRLHYPPTTRTVDDKGRLSMRLGRRCLDELMGWSAGALACLSDGDWVVLRPDPRADARRNDGSARLGSDGRLRLPAPTRRLLGVAPGEEVAVLVLPDHDAVALCHPSHLIIGAPLSLLRTTPGPGTASHLGGPDNE